MTAIGQLLGITASQRVISLCNTEYSGENFAKNTFSLGNANPLHPARLNDNPYAGPIVQFDISA